MRILLAILILFADLPVRGTTYTCANASSTVVQSNINVAVNAGDIVKVPIGTGTWSTVVTISNSITLQGSGMNSTVITNGVAGGSDLQIIAPKNGKWLTVSGFRFEANPTTGASGSQGMINVSGDNNWRFCSNYVHIGYTGVVQHGNGGLIDHCYFYGDFGNGGNPTGFYHIGHDEQWNSTIQYGTVTNWTYVEHNGFFWTVGWNGANGADDGGEGAATCFRYNAVTNTWTGGHGVDSTPKPATSEYGQELYGNNFRNDTGGTFFTVFTTRGGTGIYWGNTLSGGNFSSQMHIFYYRWEGFNYDSWQSFPASIDGWLIGSGTYAGWPGYMQPGYTGPIGGVDINTGNNTGGQTNCTEVSSPMYISSNILSGVTAPVIASDASLVFLGTNYFTNGLPVGYVPLVDPYPLGSSPPPPPPPTGLHVMLPL